MISIPLFCCPPKHCAKGSRAVSPSPAEKKELTLSSSQASLARCDNLPLWQLSFQASAPQELLAGSGAALVERQDPEHEKPRGAPMAVQRTGTRETKYSDVLSGTRQPLRSHEALGEVSRTGVCRDRRT
eukprot:scaffold1289_cov274-Pinguiococcus_pyrenoidosus.AAC.19